MIKPERILAAFSYTGNTDRHDLALGGTEGTGVGFHKGTMAEHLPASGWFTIPASAGPDNLCEPPCELVLSLLKETRTRVEDPDLSGVVWGRGRETPGYPISD